MGGGDLGLGFGRLGELSLGLRRLGHRAGKGGWREQSEWAYWVEG